MNRKNPAALHWLTVLLVLSLALLWWLAERSRLSKAVNLPNGAGISGSSPIPLEHSQDLPANHTPQEYDAITPAIVGDILVEDTQTWLLPSLPLQSDTMYQFSGNTDSHEQVSFHVQPEEVIYIQPCSTQGLIQRHSLDMDGNIASLSSLQQDILDLSVSRDGQWISYAAVNSSGGSDIWILPRAGGVAMQLSDCEAQRCTAPVWSPTRRYLAFSTRNPALDQQVGSLILYLFENDPSAGDFEIFTPEILCDQPGWSPDGMHLACLDASLPGIRILHLQSMNSTTLLSHAGMNGNWSYDGKRFYFLELVMHGTITGDILLKADFSAPELSQLDPFPGSFTELAVPRESPDGRYLLTARDDPNSQPGFQLWLHERATGETKALPGNPDETAGSFSWDFNSERILYQTFALGQPNATPQVVLLDLPTQSHEVLAQNACMPRWLP